MISVVSHAETLDYCWGFLEKDIKRALKHGHGDSMTMENLYNSIKANKMALWVVHEGQDVVAGIILSIHTGIKKTIWVEVIAGRGMDSWRGEAETALLEYKKQIGADSIEASCRIGFLKKLKNWSIKAISMELK